MRLGLLAAFWLLGVFIGLRVDVAALPLSLLIIATFAAGAVLYLHRRSIWPAVLAGALLIALLRVEAADRPLTPLTADDGATVTLRGQITDDPEATAQRIEFVLGVESIDRGEGPDPVNLNALVYGEPPEGFVASREPPYFRRGDRLALSGTVHRPRTLAERDYASYLANQGISGVVYSRDVTLVGLPEESRSGWRDWIFDLRRDLSESIQQHLPEPQSAVARALLLGQRGPLPEDLKEEFRNTGTAHLLAISGLHVGVLMALALGICSAVLGRGWGMYLIIPLLLIWLYALISGLPLSVVRAAIMGSVVLAALALGRPRAVLPTLSLSAAVMVAVSPQALQQVSFQLSFAGIAGIVLAMPYVSRVTATLGGPGLTGYGGLNYALGWLATALLVSIAATLATWPLVALHFHRIPLLGILGTVAALPSLPWILAGAFATAVGGLLHPDLGQLFGWISWIPLSYLVELVSRVPSYTVSGAWVGAGLVWAWYLTIGGLVLLAAGRPYLPAAWTVLMRAFGPSEDVRTHPALVFTPAMRLLTIGAGLVVASVFLWLQVFSGPDGKLHVYFFDVGQGDSALIVTPQGKQVLVDGGPGAESGVRAISGPMSRGDRSLEVVALTHLDADHSRGLLEVLDRYRVGSVMVGLEDPESALYPPWQASLEGGGPEKVQLWAGHRIMLEPGLVIEVLNPPDKPLGGSVADKNNNGLVLRLVYDDVSFLLAADIEARAENHLTKGDRNLASTVLKVAHHGSKTSTTPRFLSRVDPVVAVVSAGKSNRFGHPHTDVVERLEQIVGAEGLYRTDRDGAIEFISDGRRLWVKTGE